MPFLSEALHFPCQAPSMPYRRTAVTVGAMAALWATVSLCPVALALFTLGATHRHPAHANLAAVRLQRNPQPYTLTPARVGPASHAQATLATPPGRSRPAPVRNNSPHGVHKGKQEPLTPRTDAPWQGHSQGRWGQWAMPAGVVVAAMVGLYRVCAAGKPCHGAASVELVSVTPDVTPMVMAASTGSIARCRRTGFRSHRSAVPGVFLARQARPTISYTPP